MLQRNYSFFCFVVVLILARSICSMTEEKRILHQETPESLNPWKRSALCIVGTRYRSRRCRRVREFIKVKVKTKKGFCMHIERFLIKCRKTKVITSDNTTETDNPIN